MLAAQKPFPIDLLDETEVCRLVGGTRPISKSSLYRLVAAGRLPRGVLIGPNLRRYSRTEVEAAIRALFAARDGVRS